MTATLKLKDRKFFADTLKAFSSKTHATFDISNETMTISSIDSPYIYLSLDNSVFLINMPISFTIRIDELLRNINFIDSSLILLDESFKLIQFKGSESLHLLGNNESIEQFFNLENNFSFVEIPFINPANSYYIHKNTFPTRMIVSKECLNNFMTGLVTYGISENKLTISKQSSEHEEVMEITVDVLEAGHLSFHCRNDWISSTLELYDLIHTILFCFADGLLSIKYLLKDRNASYLEIQVLEVEEHKCYLNCLE